MIRFAAGVALTVAALLAMPVQAAAPTSTVTVNFTGTVTSAGGVDATAPAVGETITGWFTMWAYDGYTISNGDGHSSAGISGTSAGPGSPLMVAGGATFSGGLSLALSSAPNGQDFVQRVARDDIGLDAVTSDVDTCTLGHRLPTIFLIDVHQELPGHPLTSPFSDPAGGLSLFQPLNLAADGAVSTGSFTDSSSPDSSYGGLFSLTSLSISAVTASAVPESSGLAPCMAGVGLLGALARRRPQA